MMGSEANSPTLAFCRNALAHLAIEVPGAEFGRMASNTGHAPWRPGLCTVHEIRPEPIEMRLPRIVRYSLMHARWRRRWHLRDRVDGLSESRREIA